MELRHQRQMAPGQQRAAAARVQPLVRAREGRRTLQRRLHDPQRRAVQRARLRHQRDHRRCPRLHRPPRRERRSLLPERALYGAAQPVDRASPGDRRQLRRLPVRLLPAGGGPSVGGFADAELPGRPRDAQGLLRRGHRHGPGRGPDSRAPGTARHPAAHAGGVHQRQRLQLRPPRLLGQGQRHLPPQHVRELRQGAVSGQPAGPRPGRAGGRRDAQRDRLDADAAGVHRRRPSRGTAARPGGSILRRAAGGRDGSGARSRSDLRRVRRDPHDPHGRVEIRAALSRCRRPRGPQRAVRPGERSGRACQSGVRPGAATAYPRVAGHAGELVRRAGDGGARRPQPAGRRGGGQLRPVGGTWEDGSPAFVAH